MASNSVGVMLVLKKYVSSRVCCQLTFTELSSETRSADTNGLIVDCATHAVVFARIRTAGTKTCRKKRVFALTSPSLMRLVIPKTCFQTNWETSGFVGKLSFPCLLMVAKILACFFSNILACFFRSGQTGKSNNSPWQTSIFPC